MNETPMPHELRTQLNNELNAQKELIKKLSELESQFNLALSRLRLTIDLFMNITIDPKDAEDVAVDIAVEQDQLEKPLCKECGSTLVDDGYGEVNACTNCQ